MSSLLWASDSGLREGEILELIGSVDSPLPQRVWSPLHLASEQSLISRSGLIGLGHEYLRTAVKRRYLVDEASEKEAHQRLAEYFELKTSFFEATFHDVIEGSMAADTTLPDEDGPTMTAAQMNYNVGLITSILLRLQAALSDGEQIDHGAADIESFAEAEVLDSALGSMRPMLSEARRQFLEFLSQAIKGQTWESLHRRLSNLPFLYEAHEQRPRLVKRAWAALGEHTEHTAVESYQPVMMEPDRYPFYVAAVADVLEADGHGTDTLPLLGSLTDFTVREAGINMEFVDTANLRYGQALLAAGSTDSAVAAFRLGKRYAALSDDWHATATSSTRPRPSC